MSLTKEEWSIHVEKWQESGLKCHQYANKHQLDAKRLGWWKWNLSKGKMDIVLVEAEIAEAKPATAPIEISCKSGHLICVHPAFDDDTLFRVLRILEMKP